MLKIDPESQGQRDDRNPPKFLDADSRSLRALSVLEAVTASERPQTIPEITAACGLPRATVHRLCGMLEGAAFLRRTPVTRGLVAGPRLLALTHQLMASAAQNQHRHAILTMLGRQIGETCNLNVPDGPSMIYVDRVESEWPLRLQLPVGTRVPLYCTASGKLYLSSLPRERRRAILGEIALESRTPNTITDLDALESALDVIAGTGLGTDNEEFLDGMIAVAVPVRDSAGRLFATLATHAPTMRMSLEAAMAHAPIMRAAARKLEDFGEV